MRVFSCPAAYLPYLESALALALREIEYDRWLRRESSSRERKLTLIDEPLYDPQADANQVVAVSYVVTEPFDIVRIPA